MTSTATTPKARAAIPGKTLRTDNWLTSPLVMAAILAFFLAYVIVRGFMGKWYFVEKYGYLSLVYSPCVSENCAAGARHLGTWLPALPVFIPMAFIAFILIGAFRTTCYYYRKVGYRSLWASPQACAVREPHKKYTGETRFPLVLMNVHRYAFWAATLLLLVNTWDALHAFKGTNGGFGIGLGTVLIWANLVLLFGYSLSCHACRHIFGGRLKHFSRHPVRYRMWNLISRMNTRHGTWAMASLWSVMVLDFYIMAVSAGWISDLRIFN